MRVHRASIVALLVLLALLLTVPGVAHADVHVPSTSATPAPGPSLDLGGLGKSIAGAIFATLGDWINQYLVTSAPAVAGQGLLFALGWLGQQLLGGLSDSGALGILSRLDPDLTLGNETVRSVVGAARDAFNVLIGVGLVVYGFLCLIRFGGTNGKELGILAPRIFIGAVLLNFSQDLLRWLVDATNAVAAYLTRAGSFGLPGQTLQTLPPEQAGGWLLAVGIMTALLIVQRLLMYGLLSVLAMTAPLAIVCLAIPLWSAWFWKWINLLANLLASALLQSLALAAGSGMLGAALARSDNTALQQLYAGGLGVAVLSLAIVLPAMLGTGILGGTTLGLAHRMARRLPATAGAVPAVADGGDPVVGNGQRENGQPSWQPTVYQRLPSGMGDPAPALPPPTYVEFLPKRLPPPAE